MKKQVVEEKEKIAIELKDRTVVLTLERFDSDCDMDEFTNIHHHNLWGEILTCSTALNRIGNLLADVNQILAQTKLDWEIFIAQMKEEQKKKLEFETLDSKGNVKYSKPTADELEMSVVRLPQYKVKKLNLIKMQKNYDVINSWYWAVKDKSEKLNKITDKLRPEEFEKDILEEKINGVIIKAFKKTIK